MQAVCSVDSVQNGRRSLPDKVLISRIYKELQKLNISITELPVNKLVNEVDTSPKKKLKCLINSFKKYLIFLAVNKSKLKPLISVSMASARKQRGTWGKTTLCIIGGSMSWCNQCGDQCGKLSKKLKEVTLLYDPALSPVITYLRCCVHSASQKFVHPCLLLLYS